jgi:hypothetical protein
MKQEKVLAGMLNAPISIKWAHVRKKQNLLFYHGIFAIHQHFDGAVKVKMGPIRMKR